MRLRASESGSGAVAVAAAAPAGVSLEQLAGILEVAGPAAAMVAGGSLVRRISHCSGQRGGPKAIGSSAGSGPGGCSWHGVQVDSPWLVLGRQGPQRRI